MLLHLDVERCLIKLFMWTSSKNNICPWKISNLIPKITSLTDKVGSKDAYIQKDLSYTISRNVGTCGILWQIKLLEKVCQPIGGPFSSTVSTPLNLLAPIQLWNKLVQFSFYVLGFKLLLRFEKKTWFSICYDSKTL